MEDRCPQCAELLQWDGGYVCHSCEQHYHKQVYCPSCHRPLEKLQACGSVSYFCNTCNELKSKSAVNTVFTASDYEA